MAIAPTPAEMPPADMGAEPMADEGTEAPDESMEPAVLFTVLGPPEGPYVLMSGDEPEGEGAAAADAPKLATPQELMRAIMALLNPDKGAEDAFVGASKSAPPPAAA